MSQEAKEFKQTMRRLSLRIESSFEDLLKSAAPNEGKRYKLTKLLKLEQGATSSFQADSKITAYFQLPYQERSSRAFFEIFGVGPYPWLLDQFQLNFSSAQISESKIFHLSVNLHQILGFQLGLPEEIVDVKILHLTIYRLTHPNWWQPKSGIEISEFFSSWHHVVSQKFGDRYDPVFSQLFESIENLALASETDLKVEGGVAEIEKCPEQKAPTQTELDWLKEIVEALKAGSPPPLYPLSRGPQHGDMKNIEKIVRTLRIHHSNSRKNPRALLDLKRHLLMTSLAINQSFGQKAS